MNKNNTQANNFFNNNKINKLNKLPIVIIENIKTPENLGSIIRLCDNIGIKEIYIINQTSKLRESKIKSTSSTAFNNVKITNCNYNDLNMFSDYSIYIVETHLNASNIYKTILPKKSAFIFGNESNGVSYFLLERFKSKIYIPMHGETKSMNLSQSVAVILFEWLRQNFYL